MRKVLFKNKIYGNAKKETRGPKGVTCAKPMSPNQK